MRKLCLAIAVSAIVLPSLFLSACEQYHSGPTMSFPTGHSLNPGTPPPGVKPVPDFKVEKEVQ